VLGCTEYELAADQISRAVPGAVMFGSAGAVAAQALRRLPAASASEFSPGNDRHPPASDRHPPASDRHAHASDRRPAATVRVLLSGRLAVLPPAALRYPEGRLLAPLVVLDGDEQPDDREPMAGSAASL
jgi:glutamate racemase